MDSVIYTLLCPRDLKVQRDEEDYGAACLWTMNFSLPVRGTAPQQIFFVRLCQLISSYLCFLYVLQYVAGQLTKLSSFRSQNLSFPLACCLGPGAVWTQSEPCQNNDYKISSAVHLVAVKCMGRYTAQFVFQTLDKNHIANWLSYLSMLIMRERNGFSEPIIQNGLRNFAFVSGYS